MPQTIAKALAERLRCQSQAGEKVLHAAAENSGAVFGDPAEVLSVRGNVSDVALTNHLWLLDAVASGAVRGNLGALEAARPATIEGAVAFLAPRDTDSADQARERLRQVNEALASRVEGLSDADLDKTVDMSFYGERPLSEMLFLVIEHGSLHFGQAWGILKGKGLA